MANTPTTSTTSIPLTDYAWSLRTEALTAANWRGHRLGRFTWDHYRGGLRGNATCQDCPADVQVLTNPDANEIEVGGAAVALTCPFSLMALTESESAVV